MIKSDWAFSWRGSEFTYGVAIHPLHSPRIILCLPGWDGDIDGYSQKYLKLAEFLVSQGAGAVVRAGNHPFDDLDYEDSCIAQARSMIDTAARNAVEICLTTNPDLCLMGYSAGASAFAAVASLFDSVKTLLLIAPSQDAGKERMKRSLSSFPGKVFIVSGDSDLEVGTFPQSLVHWGADLGRRTYVQIPQCDHQFSGIRNGRIMSQAPLWAFAGLAPFPHPDAGIVLYS